MTDEQIVKAIRLREKIDEAEKRIKDFQKSSPNVIKSLYSPSHRDNAREECFCLIFDREDQLYSLILHHFQNQLLELQQEFEKL